MKANLKIVAGVGAAMLFAGSANAAVLSATPQVYSKEGVSATGLPVALPAVTAILAADYSLEDRISFTIAGATPTAGAAIPSMTCNNGIIVGYLNTSGNVVNFRVTQTDVANNLGATCTINNISVTRASLAASTSVTGTYRAVTIAGEVIDTGCATAGSPGAVVACAQNVVPNVVTLASVVTQFSAGVTTNATPFNGVIDVEADRKVFAFPDEVTNLLTSDSLRITVRNRGNVLEPVAPVSGALALTADFSFLAGPDGRCGTGDDTGSVVSQAAGIATFAGGNCGVAAINYGQAFAAGQDATVNDTIVILLPLGNQSVKLSPQTFAGSYAFSWPTANVSRLDFSAGAWTINGALVFVPYMPYGDSISQIIYISNRGTQDADITVDAFDENGASYSFDVGQVAGGTVRKLTAEILNGLTLAGFQAPGKVAFELTVNAPDSDIDVYSAYNVGGSDRGTVVNSQNGKALQ